MCSRLRRQRAGTAPVVYWLKSPLGLREAGIPSRPRPSEEVTIWKVALLSLALGTNELGNRLPGLEYNGLSDSFLLTCGEIE